MPFTPCRIEYYSPVDEGFLLCRAHTDQLCARASLISRHEKHSVKGKTNFSTTYTRYNFPPGPCLSQKKKKERKKTPFIRATNLCRCSSFHAVHDYRDENHAHPIRTQRRRHHHHLQLHALLDLVLDQRRHRIGGYPRDPAISATGMSSWVRRSFRCAGTRII